MKRVAICALLLGFVPSVLFSSEAWGPDLIEFNLEDLSKNQTMLWLSGFSYSSTELLRLAGCFENAQYIESKELIGALNKAFAGQRVTSEVVASELGRYVSLNYACAVFNSKQHQKVDSADNAH